VQGICTTLVIFAPDGSAAVLFRETWDGRNFEPNPGGSCSARTGPCNPAPPPYTRMHTWEFTVTKGNVSSNRNYGDPPPQHGQKFS